MNEYSSSQCSSGIIVKDYYFFGNDKPSMKPGNSILSFLIFLMKDSRISIKFYDLNYKTNCLEEESIFFRNSIGDYYGL